MMKNPVVIALLLTIVLVSCTEIYDPDIGGNKKVLVIEGLVTDQAEPYIIRLSYALPYDTVDYAKVPVSQAEIVIRDNEGNSFYLMENYFNPGVYYTDPSEFVASAGLLYTLHISAPDGEVYESSPQLLEEERKFDSISGIRTIKGFYYTNPFGDIFIKNYKGGKIYLDYHNADAGFTKYRYVYSYYIQFTAENMELDDPPTIYVVSKTRSHEVNISGSDYSLVSNSIRHELCFFPFEKSYYPFTYNWPDSQYSNFIDKHIIIFDQYNLNDQTYEYYTGISNQLGAEGKIFDPVAAQLNGNIRCITNPDKPVIGFFEASSYQSYSYVINQGYGNEPVLFYEISGMGRTPDYGVYVGAPPYFWVW